MLRVLIIEDDELSMMAIKTLLAHFETYWARCSSEAREYYQYIKFDWALVDVDLEHKGAGIQLASELSTRGVKVTMVTGHRSDEFLSQALAAGAQDILSKPFDPGELQEIIHSLNQDNCLKLQKLKSYLEIASKNGKSAFNCIATSLLREIPILLTGESGTGKTRLASLIHQTFNDEKAPFIHLNCAEIPEALAESILFGHVKGSFSGADQNRTGLVELADRGTLFLDEVATLSPKVQAKLLKVVESKSFRKVGGEHEKRVSFRLISATCEDIGQMEFRRDLFFRLAGTCIELLPLAKAQGLALSVTKDIFDASTRRMILTSEAKRYLESLDLDGNIRELIMGLKKAMGLRKILIDEKDLRVIFKRDSLTKSKSFRSQVSRFERELVERTFHTCGKSVRRTLRELEITSSTFYRIMNLQGTVN